MNIESKPTQQDYNRLRRALIGIFVILLVFIVGSSVHDFASNVNPISEGLACLIIYGPVPIIAIVALLRAPFTPQSDPTHERFAKGAIYGRRSCVLGGLGMIGCCVAGLLVMGPAFYVVFSGGIALGLAFVLWSSRFPKVAPSKTRTCL